MPRFLWLPLLLLSAAGVAAGPGALSPAVPAAAAASVGSFGACPAAATATIDTLYRWHLAHQESSGGRSTLAGQRELFTPLLYDRLRRGFALTPADGAYVDFDPFSGTQVSTHGARVQGCRRLPDGVLEARVAVQASLRRTSTEPPQQLLFRLEPGPGGAGWRIADIQYPGERSFSLSRLLADILHHARTAAPRPDAP
ncbi:MAG: hypothetical protein ACKO5F_14560 [Synechococcus sp.]